MTRRVTAKDAEATIAMLNRERRQAAGADPHAYECWAGRGGTCRPDCSCSCHATPPMKPATIAAPTKETPTDSRSARTARNAALAAEQHDVWLATRPAATTTEQENTTVPLTSTTKARKAKATAKAQAAKPAKAKAAAKPAAAPKPARLEAPEGQKRCPGYTSLDGSYVQAEHLLPADREHFHANKGSKDGLWSQCKPCANSYQKDWLARKAAKEGKPAPTTRAAKQAAKVAAGPTYADERAEKLAGMKRMPKGWATEVVNGTIYALPTDPGPLGTPEGQAALELVNAARAKANGHATPVLGADLLAE